MLNIKIIATGEFKENYLKEAAAEYKKRLGAWCKVEEYIFREEKLPDNPSSTQIAEALKTEEKIILSKIPQKAYVIAMCVEGKQLSSEELADKIGIAVGTVKRFEKTGEVQFNHLLRIALVLGRLDDFKTLFAAEDVPASLYNFKVEKVRQRARKKRSSKLF